MSQWEKHFQKNAIAPWAENNLQKTPARREA
jgi:hypothetical protein